MKSNILEVATYSHTSLERECEQLSDRLTAQSTSMNSYFYFVEKEGDGEGGGREGDGEIDSWIRKFIEEINFYYPHKEKRSFCRSQKNFLGRIIVKILLR